MLCPFCGAEFSDARGTCARCGADPSLSPTRAGRSPGFDPLAELGLRPGESFAQRYTIVDEVGSGGMGRVYKAVDQKLGTAVALKLIPPEQLARPSSLERFRRELVLARQVTHSNVCRVHDLGEVDDLHYLSMEYVDGQNLRDWVQAVGRLSPQQTVSVGRQICAGLTAIHRQDIVHRDLKPTNIMLDRSGRVVVMDFGLAYHPREDQVTARGEVLGTLAYLAPEQARGQPPERASDIYSLGLILFEMLTGRRAPGDGLSLPLALRDRSETCPAPSRFASEVPPSLDRLVLRCLAREPGKRFGSVEEVDRALTQVEASSRPPGELLLSGRTAKLGALVALLVVGAILLVVERPSEPGDLALMRFGYRGPGQYSYLRDLIPILLSRELRDTPDLALVPFETSRSFGGEENARSVAGQLGVGRVLRGEISIEEGRLRTALRLFDAAGERAVWSSSFDSRMADVVETAGEMAREIRGALGTRAGPAARGPNAAGFEIYLEGKRALEGWDVERNHARAAEAFSRAIEADGRFAEAHAGLALALWKQYEETHQPHLVARALAAAERAQSLAPSLPEAHLALGAVQLGQGRSAEAASAFEKALQLAPADDAICRHIASAYVALGRNEEAEAFYQKAIDLRPGFWENYNFKGASCLRTGKLEQAKALFRRVLELRPESDTGYNNLAAAHLLGGEFMEAEPLLRAALRIQPTPQVHNNLGFVYYATANYRSAADEFRAAIAAGLDHAMPWEGLGDAYRQMGRRTEAGEAYAKAIELAGARLAVNPKDSEARALMAMSLAGAGRCQDAAREASRAAEEAPGSPTIHYYAAVAFTVCGNREAGVRHARGAIEAGGKVDVRTNPDLKILLDDPSIREQLR